MASSKGPVSFEAKIRLLLIWSYVGFDKRLTSKWRSHKASYQASGGKGEKPGHSRDAAGLVVLVNRRDTGHTLEDIANGIFGPVVGGEVDHADCSDTCQRWKAT